MATQQIITCDECGAQRGDSNHWFAVTDARDADLPSFHVLRLTDSEQIYAGPVTHICGAACLTLRLAKWQSALSSPVVTNDTNTETAHDNPANDGDAAGRV